ncbi:MAG: zf-HC2 domain-containing protein [Gemmatimonadota bacterium]
MTRDRAEHLSAERLQAFLEGDLSKRERSAVEEHLESCKRCSAELDGWRVLFDDLSGLSAHRPHQGFAERVMSEVDVPEPVSLAARVRGRIEAGLTGSPEDVLDGETIQDFLEGAFGPRRTRQIEAHLAASEQCSREVDEWAVLFRELDALPRLAPSQGFAEQVMAHVDTTASQPWAVRLRERLAGLVRGDSSVCAPADILQDFVDGALPSRKLARVRAHVGSCTSCAAEVHAWRQLHVHLHRLESPAPANGFAERVMAAYRIEQMMAAAAPVPLRSKAAVAVRRTLGRPREALAALSGIAVTPMAIFGVAAWAVFSHPSVTLGSLLSFVAWQISDVVAMAGSGLANTVTNATSAVGGQAAVDALTGSPALLGSAVVAYLVISAFALRVLYKNLFAGRPADGRYAHARLAS